MTISIIQEHALSESTKAKFGIMSRVAEVIICSSVSNFTKIG